MIDRFFKSLKKRIGVKTLVILDNTGEIRDLFARSRSDGRRISDIATQLFELLAITERKDEDIDEIILPLEDVKLLAFNHPQFIVVLLTSRDEDISLLRLYLDVGIRDLTSHRRTMRKINKWPLHKDEHFLLSTATSDDAELLQKFLGKENAGR